MTWFPTWLWYVISGIFAFFVLLFFISCAILSHCLDRHDDEEEWH